MKHLVRITAILISLTTITVHSAAHKAPPKPIAEITVADLIGLSWNERGHCEIISSLNKEQNNPSLSVTLAYSEHDNMKSPAVLSSIAQVLNQKKTFDNHKTFKGICKEEIAKYVAPIDNQEILDNSPYNLIALCLNIKADRMMEVGCIQVITGKFPSALQGSQVLLKKDLQARAYSNYLFFAADPIENPQNDAQKLQSEDPTKPFHLVIDLALWRHITALRRNTLKQERKKTQREITDNSLAQCIQQ